MNVEEKPKLALENLLLYIGCQATIWRRGEAVLHPCFSEMSVKLWMCQYWSPWC